jgi:predicted SnoaL-like aldol condensation-catalyzing enzyme
MNSATFLSKKNDVPAKISATDTATNKAIAWKAQYGLIVEKDFSTLEKYFNEDYIQHNPALRNGRTELTQFKKANIPLATSEVLFSIADRDLVFFVERVTGLMPEPLCFFDIYRMDEGKIVEHWDAYSRIEGPNPSGRTMFDGTKDIGDPAATEETRAVVTRLISNVFILDHLDRLGRYVADDVKQFSPSIGDGLDALTKHFLQSQWFSGHVSYRSLRKVIAEGQVAVTASDAVIGEEPYAIFDLWRVEDGKVVEHTSLRQRVEKATFHNNPRI